MGLAGELREGDPGAQDSWWQGEFGEQRGGGLLRRDLCGVWVYQGSLLCEWEAEDRGDIFFRHTPSNN